MFGLKMYLVHKKIKSGGKDVFVTELLASKEFREDIMKVISRAITRKDDARALEGEAGAMSLLDIAASTLVDEQAAIEVKSVDDEAKEAIDAAMALIEDE
jgi:hypothetical protein